MEILARDAARILILVFFAVLFLQSGLDKIFDFQGNLQYFQSVFAKTMPARLVSILFVWILVLETAAGAACAAGALAGFSGHAFIGKAAMIGVLCTLIQLFAGLRIAHDYQGAAAIVPYFIAAIAGLLLHQ